MTGATGRRSICCIFANDRFLKEERNLVRHFTAKLSNILICYLALHWQLSLFSIFSIDYPVLLFLFHFICIRYTGCKPYWIMALTRKISLWKLNSDVDYRNKSSEQLLTYVSTDIHIYLTVQLPPKKKN